MKKIAILFCCIIPIFVHAQVSSGIKFSTAKNLQEVLMQAQKENKPIFVDAYATWCGPCKMMDRDVFSNQQVADYVNANFIAIKVQMDSTKNDNEYIKGWYADAANWKLYVTAFPTFLFFTPEGKYSGKEEGFYKQQEFVAVLKKNIDPHGSYLAQLKSFKDGSLNKTQLLKLAYWAKENKDDSLAMQIARVYKSRYVDNAPIDSLLNPSADRFHATFIDLFSFKDKIIQYIYEHQKVTDLKFGRWPQYSRNLTDYVIGRDYIYNNISPNKSLDTISPDWKKIERNIAKTFDKKIAKRLTLNAKIGWLYKQKDWDQAVKLEFEKIDRYGMDTTGLGKVSVNNLVYDVVFKYINNAALLKKAATLMKTIVDLDGETDHAGLDTYASILYKAGQKKQAIEVEKKALDLVEKQNDKINTKFYREVIVKMQNDQPIWK
ncbi:Protein of unknown function, DUF255 [Chitinophaga sp. CF118]|uniref:thioredoxin family protein n=1 Tax=Chitinophaga sp. CF118 TaxID=1884367 RepID=UPI0008EE67EF|nr:DUF255 domain-containing protein [Chitinophaga sp. CF118]SFF07050.1 Protein of unknown function, DUF255 [Chitinophaga sp. CF118]